MRKTIAILGRQPSLGLAELESIYGPDLLKPFGENCIVNDVVSIDDFRKIGGSTRVGIVLLEIDTNKWSRIEQEILKNLSSIFPDVEGKLNFGISAFGVKVSPREIAKTALLVKKSLKETGQSVRMVPQKTVELNAATVLYNKLTSGKGIELLAVSDGVKTLIGYTTIIQDIDAYSARDQARPFRDAKVGMLPPKLAQIIINLAVGRDGSGIGDWGLGKEITKETENAAIPILNPQSSICILDAFCGTGVVLQEATLMDYDVYGTDLEPRMVQYSIDNLKWLDEKYLDLGDYRRIEIGDAVNHKWDFSKIEKTSRIFVAGETYLGQPLSVLPTGEHLSKIIYEVNLLHHKFLENISSQVPSGTRFCLAVPTWRGKREFLHLPMLDYLDDLGYTRMRFKHAENKDLIYHRENQVVGRELLVLKKR